MKLQNSLVRRGGKTSSTWSGNTERILAYTDNKGLRFRFSIPSKGGGETDIQLSVGNEDMAELLKALARTCPDLASVFAEAGGIAVAESLKALGQKGAGA